MWNENMVKLATIFHESIIFLTIGNGAPKMQPAFLLAAAAFSFANTWILWPWVGESLLLVAFENKNGGVFRGSVSAEWNRAIMLVNVQGGWVNHSSGIAAIIDAHLSWWCHQRGIHWSGQLFRMHGRLWISVRGQKSDFPGSHQSCW